jgi:beta-alanine--pyruvate transaminase
MPDPRDFNAYWMPFTANAQFKSVPRLFASAAGVYYTTDDGRQVLDAASGLWCTNAGHCHPKIVEAIRTAAGELDYAPSFQAGHPRAFALADRVADMLPGTLDHVFFTNSGSEAVESALKIALAYHRRNDEASRTRLIGRVRGYHGTNFGGISVGGLVNNRKDYTPLLPGVDHLPDMLNISENAFTKGQPEQGVDLADVLEEMVALHGGETIAAVLVEPVIGSGGVVIPPLGYNERLREITREHGILLIFDEVINAFGRCGGPTAAEVFNLEPDLICIAKGLTNGSVPMGAVGVQRDIYERFVTGEDIGIEFFHGYTYSGHPLAAAAGEAAMDVFMEDGLIAESQSLISYFEKAVHGLKGCANVIDIRNFGLMAGVELAPCEDGVGKRGFEAFLKAYENGVFFRVSGDVFQLSPPLICDRHHIDTMMEVLGEAINATV